MKENKKIDSIFRKQLQDYSASPPAEVWEEVQEQLSASKKRFLPVFRKYAAGIILLLGIGGASLIYNHIGNKTTKWLTDETGKAPEMKTVNPDSSSTSVSRPSPLSKKIVPENPEKSIPSLKQPSRIKDNQNTRINLPKEPRTALVKNIIHEPTPSPEKKTGSKLPVYISSLNRLPLQRTVIIPQDSLKKQHNPPSLISKLSIPLEKQSKLPKIKNSSFTIAAFASPLYSYRDLGNLPSGTSGYFNDAESGKITYSGGFDIGFKTGRRFSIHSGLIYNRMGITVNKILAVSEMPVSLDETAHYHRDASSPYILSNSIGSVDRTYEEIQNPATYEYTSLNSADPVNTNENNLYYLNSEGFYNPADNFQEDEGYLNQYFNYLEIPVIVKFLVIDRKIDLNLTGGISANFLLSNSVFYVNDNENTKIGSTKDIQSVNYAGNIGIGLDYSLGKQWKLMMEPRFKYYINSINQENLIRNHPYSFGFYSGILFEF